MITVRRASAADADAILALATDFATSFAVEGAAYRVSFAQVIDKVDACVLVAEAEGTVVGYLLAFEHPTLHANGPVTWVDELAVAESHQRSGIGRQLMAAAELWARERGCVMVALATRRAAAFYDEVGYEASATFYRKLL